MIRIPPFGDSHVHFTVEGRPASEAELEKIIDTCQRYGIFSLKDMGHRSGIGLKAETVSGKRLMVRTAGYALFKKGGYGTFLGKGVEGKEDIKKAVKEISDAGADFLKVINSGIVSTKARGLVTGGGFSPGELKTIREEAGKRNLEVACHANSDTAIRNAVAAGVASIEHGFFVSRETLHMMVESDVAWTPTVYALRALTSFVGPSERAHIEKVVSDHMESLRYAASAGVILRVGTDSGSKGVHHGESFCKELRLWQKAGLTTEQILSAACMNEDEIQRGNYLLVRKDFISTGRVEAAYRLGVRVVSRTGA